MCFLCSYRVSGSISSPLYFASYLTKNVCIGPQQRPDALYGTWVVVIIASATAATRCCYFAVRPTLRLFCAE